jgi:hypothetical protein
VHLGKPPRQPALSPTPEQGVETLLKSGGRENCASPFLCWCDALANSAKVAEEMAPQVLDECMTRNDHPATAVAFQPAHQAEARRESAVIGLDAIVGVLFGVMNRVR